MLAFIIFVVASLLCGACLALANIMGENYEDRAALLFLIGALIFGVTVAAVIWYKLFGF